MAHTLTNGTAQTILDYASYEYDIREMDGKSQDYKDTHKDMCNIYEDMVANNDDLNTFPKKISSSCCLNAILKYVLFSQEDNYNIQVKQLPTNPYVFRFIIDNYTCRLPLLTARKLLYILKAYGAKIVPDKLDRNVTPERTAFLRDLCYRGKSDISIPAYTPIAVLAKKVRITINGWNSPANVAEDDDVENKVSQASIRFRGAEWFEAVQNNVYLIGAGGLGSNIAVSLCRLLGDKELTIYDPDHIEYKNLAGQNFGISDIGKSKVAVVKGQCVNFNPLINVNYFNVAFEDFSDTTKIPLATITGLDSMAARSLVYYKWQALAATVNYPIVLLDARLSAETWQVFCVTSDNKEAQKEYENKWLFSDEEADEGICSYKQTAYAAQMCASFVTNLYVNFCTNNIKATDDPTRRFLPFMTEYDATQMILRFQNI